MYTTHDEPDFWLNLPLIDEHIKKINKMSLEEKKAYFDEIEGKNV